MKALILLYLLDAPEWVRWCAVDKSGELWFYSNEPQIDTECDYWDSDADRNKHHRTVTKVKISLDKIIWEKCKISVDELKL